MIKEGAATDDPPAAPDFERVQTIEVITVVPTKLAAQGCAGAMPLYRNRCTRLPSVLSPT